MVVCCAQEQSGNGNRTLAPTPEKANQCHRFDFAKGSCILLNVINESNGNPVIVSKTDLNDGNIIFSRKC